MPRHSAPYRNERVEQAAVAHRPLRVVRAQFSLDELALIARAIGEFLPIRPSLASGLFLPGRVGNGCPGEAALEGLRACAGVRFRGMIRLSEMQTRYHTAC